MCRSKDWDQHVRDECGDIRDAIDWFWGRLPFPVSTRSHTEHSKTVAQPVEVKVPEERRLNATTEVFSAHGSAGSIV